MVKIRLGHITRHFPLHHLSPSEILISSDKKAPGKFENAIPHLETDEGWRLIFNQEVPFQIFDLVEVEWVYLPIIFLVNRFSYFIVLF